jgi:hypothetical protein
MVVFGGVLALMNPVPADDDTDPDGCSLAASGEVQPLITPKDVELRARGGHPAPGEKTCIWSAYQRGLTADVPADGSLSLSFYHFANAAKAEAQIWRLAKDAPPPPSLVRTCPLIDYWLCSPFRHQRSSRRSTATGAFSASRMARASTAPGSIIAAAAS